MNINHCFINIPAAERNRPVYRIISLERLQELFTQRVNTLVKPMGWEDPFENLIPALKGRLPSGEIVEFSQRYDFYGQCWTLAAESDAMWRIYSRNKRSVRIKVRLKTLVETLAYTAIGIVLVGKVRYIHTDGLLNWARRVIRDAPVPDVRVLGKTLLVKRTAFAHEQEVRLLYFHSPDQHSWLFQYGIDPHELIGDIVVDPRLSVKEATALIEEIRATTYFQGAIKHSTLYAPPSELVLGLGQAYARVPRTRKRVTYRGELRTTAFSTAHDYQQLELPVRDLRFTDK